MTAREALARMRDLPFQDLDAIIGRTTAVILAPHQDDESLGCGGLIAEACARGRSLVVIFITDGTGSHPNSRLFPPARLRVVREQEARSALRELGLDARHSVFLGVRDTEAPHEGIAFDAVVDSIVQVAADRGAATLLAPWWNDPHGDHLAAHRMAVAAARRLGARHLSYPVWGWILEPTAPVAGSVRGARLDIKPHLVAKQRAIAAHQSQHGELITDDPDGFRLSSGMMARFQEPFEVFLENDDA